jgi:hypothetical protein
VLTKSSFVFFLSVLFAGNHAAGTMSGDSSIASYPDRSVIAMTKTGFRGREKHDSDFDGDFDFDIVINQ